MKHLAFLRKRRLQLRNLFWCRSSSASSRVRSALTVDSSCLTSAGRARPGRIAGPPLPPRPAPAADRASPESSPAGRKSLRRGWPLPSELRPRPRSSAAPAVRASCKSSPEDACSPPGSPRYPQGQETRRCAPFSSRGPPLPFKPAPATGSPIRLCRVQLRRARRHRVRAKGAAGGRDSSPRSGGGGPRRRWRGRRARDLSRCLRP